MVLGLGEWHATADLNEELVCYGLGSCVALCAYDPVAHVAGMAHMVLPDSSLAPSARGGPKFVDVAVPMVLERMAELGALPTRTRISLVGGAHILRTVGLTAGPQIGERNVEAALAALRASGMRVHAQEVGGSRGRTVVLSPGTGELSVTTAGLSGT